MAPVDEPVKDGYFGLAGFEKLGVPKFDMIYPTSEKNDAEVHNILLVHSCSYLTTVARIISKIKLVS